MSEKKIDNTRRNLIVATAALGGVGRRRGIAVPFAWSWWPSERAKAAGAPVEADISGIAPGELKIVEWRGKPVWIMRPDEGAARRGKEGRRQGQRPEVRGAAAAGIREERIPLDQARSHGARRHLLPSRLFAAVDGR
jgi:Rieske Fe-S protein